MNKKIAILLRKFLTGKSSSTEQADLDNWFEHTASTVNAGDILCSWPEIKGQMWKHIAEKIKPVKRAPLLSLVWFRSAIAASILLTVGISAYIFRFAGNNTDKPQYAATQISISTGTGEMKQIIFSDGTQVWLNARSTIRYSDDYGKKMRKVELSGEAFFEVAHDTAKPFVVYTFHSITSVLGTSFSIHAYPNEKQFVGVARGKVSVSLPNARGQNDCKLMPGEKVSFDPHTKKVENSHIDPDQLMSWKNNVLYFDSLPLSEVAATLERKFGVPIIIKNTQLANRVFKGTFENKPLSGILHSIGLSMGLTIKQVNNTFELSSNE
jgi:transmembrane sensor